MLLNNSVYDAFHKNHNKQSVSHNGILGIRISPGKDEDCHIEEYDV